MIDIEDKDLILTRNGYTSKKSGKYDKVYNKEKINEFYEEFCKLSLLVTHKDIVPEFTKLSEKDKAKVLNKTIVEQKEKITAELIRLLNVSPKFLNTKYYENLLEINANYNNLVDQVKELMEPTVQEIIEKYNKQFELVKDVCEHVKSNTVNYPVGYDKQ